MTETSTPAVIRLQDYATPAFAIDTVDLVFDLGEQDATVTATLMMRRLDQGSGDLILDGRLDASDDAARDATTGGGQAARLQAIAVDGVPLPADRYTLDEEHLTIRGLGETFTLTTTRRLTPSANKSLEGLYASGSGLFTQCEAEGFRKITWFLDRPDVMSTYTVTLRADPARYPVLLSNGNKVREGDVVVDGKTVREAVWHDPWRKPCYLFAVVAADLKANSGTFTTKSGQKVDLHVWVKPSDLDQTDHCLESLKKSMAWDEVRFGREYDLEVFNLVAVSDFNMGAMENKGLNIFNTKYVLARPDTATDVDYNGIEGVVGHEYFHNWSGNRVTCRDWFQLSLKEGFTVYRDQEFSSDMGSRAVQRIEDVRKLRGMQFPEDRGPTAHPVRPESYVEISNFYTVTIYEKGAEVVRMYQTLLGDETFRKGTDLYFGRHDGQAVTTDDFRACMAEVSGRDLSQFSRWYSQAGTPHVTSSSSWDAAAGTLRLTLQQTLAPTPKQPEKLPMHIPVMAALLSPSGTKLPLNVDGKTWEGECLLELTEASQTFVFTGLSLKDGEKPVVSLLRNFSAPVILTTDDDEAALLTRMAWDDDAFNKAEAAQELYLRHLESVVPAVQAGQTPAAPSPALVDAVRTTLRSVLSADSPADPALVALALAIPGIDVIGDRLPWADYASAHIAREALTTVLARAVGEELVMVDEALSKQLDGAAYVYAPEPVGARSLRNLVTGWRFRLDQGVAATHLARATNMTDTQAALALLAQTTSTARDQAFADFYAKYRHEALMIDKWFILQAQTTRASALDDVDALLKHEAFSLENPNRARALVTAFAMGNPLHFHDASGRGYVFLADQVMALDAFNPQIAARFLTPLTRWARQDEARQAIMKRELQRVLGRKGVSRDVYEIASKSLEG